MDPSSHLCLRSANLYIYIYIYIVRDIECIEVRLCVTFIGKTCKLTVVNSLKLWQQYSISKLAVIISCICFVKTLFRSWQYQYEVIKRNDNLKLYAEIHSVGLKYCFGHCVTVNKLFLFILLFNQLYSRCQL